MPYYECVFIARQDISAPQAEALADQFVKVIEEGGGTVPKREYWGLRSLAYRIRKNRKGHYIFLNVDAPPSAIEEMERQMRINEDVIRHMTVRTEALLSGPSAMLQSRASRGDERGDRERGDRERGDRERGDRDRDRRRDDRDRSPRWGDDRPRSDRGEENSMGRAQAGAEGGQL